MDDTAAHFLLRLTPSLTPIGTIRAYQMPGTDHYKLTRLAVLKDYRKYKFGRALVLTLHEWVRQHALQAGALGPVKLICHSQLPVKGFYAKFGYESEVSTSLHHAADWLAQDLGSFNASPGRWIWRRRRSSSEDGLPDAVSTVVHDMTYRPYWYCVYIHESCRCLYMSRGGGR